MTWEDICRVRKMASYSQWWKYLYKCWEVYDSWWSLEPISSISDWRGHDWAQALAMQLWHSSDFLRNPPFSLAIPCQVRSVVWLLKLSLSWWHWKPLMLGDFDLRSPQKLCWTLRTASQSGVINQCHHAVH